MQPPICPSSVRKLTLYNGCSVAYSDEGKGSQTLLFVHGLGAYSGTWHKNITALRKHFRCIAIDLPGNGYSDTGDYTYTMDFFARCLIDFIGRMGLVQVTIVGHSMGGQIAMTAALMLPACCERLVLCAPAGFETFTHHEQLMYKASLQYMSLLSSNEQAIQHLVHKSFYKKSGDAGRLQKILSSIAGRQPGRHYKQMTDRCMAAMMSEPVAHRLGQLRHPVLVLFGEHDDLIPNPLFHPVRTRTIAESGMQSLRKGTLHMLPGCGHFVQWECASRVNSLIAAWMRHPT